MKKVIAVLCLLLVSAPLAGCIENSESPITFVPSSSCTAIYHLEFFDLSNDEFGEWGGKVTFVSSEGTEEDISYFSSEKKYVFLDESMDWSIEYTFYEDDIGFIANGKMYGGNNRNGDSGTVELELTHHTGQAHDVTIQEEGGVTFSSCGTDDVHVEFFDLSAFSFCCWDGRVEFSTEEHEAVVIYDFSSEKKYVTLEEGYVWTMKYTFYEDDIGFIIDGVEHGGNNDEGDSGSITIDLA